MNNLPTEIIVKITSFLTLSDKPNMARICKHLHQAISESTLYSDLVLKDQVTFGKATELCDKRNFGHQVHHLTFGMMQYDVELLSRLPTMFKHLQSLEIQGITMMGNEHFQGAKDWNRVEKLVDTIAGKVSIRMLELLTFERLRVLDVGWPSEYFRGIQCYDMTKQLIQAIKNAPSLETLNVKNSVIKIADVEDLHARATKLKHLILNDVWIFKNDSIDNKVV